MDNLSFLFLFAMILHNPCICKDQYTDALIATRKMVVFFRLSEEEFNERVESDPRYYELDSDFGFGISPFIEYLQKHAIHFEITTKSKVILKYDNITYTINIREGMNPYGIIFFNGNSCPYVSYGPYPYEYYIELFNQYFD